jgi:hypothetical protein
MQPRWRRLRVKVTGLSVGRRAFRTEGEIVVIGESVVSVSYCQLRPILVPQKFGPEFVDRI